MNIQIFGTSKCFDTKKAQRYFKERGIKFQMIDLKEKEMSRGEFENVARALGGWEQLVNPAAKDKQTLALLDALVDWQKEDKLFENQQLFKTPIVRNGKKATVGYQPEIWKMWDLYDPGRTRPAPPPPRPADPWPADRRAGAGGHCNGRAGRCEGCGHPV